MTPIRASFSAPPEASESNPSAESRPASLTPHGESPLLRLDENVVSGASQSRTGGTINVSPDDPLPSIEGCLESPAATTPRGSQQSVLLTPCSSKSAYTPSFSTPTQSPAASPLFRFRTDPKGHRSPAERGETDSIADQLSDMKLSLSSMNFGMREMADAISNVANDADQRFSLSGVASLTPRGLSLSPRPPRRSRGSSQVNVSPHNVEDEEPPSDRFHDSEVQRALGDAKDLMSRLVAALGSTSLHIKPDSTIRRLHEQAQSLAQFQCPLTRTIGFVGDSGAGKSSVLNSLLDFKGLARASSSGAACTCVATEYHFHSSSDFVIELELFSLDGLKKQIADLLQSYRHFNLKAKWSNDRLEVEECREQAQVALDTFRAIFRGSFDDEKVLLDDEMEIVLSRLQSWAEEGRPAHLGERQRRDSLEKCSELLMHLTSEVTASREPAVWPYIKKIKVFLNSHILSKGLVLVDLPGLRDLNYARKNVTERYLIECDEIFAICNIGRAVTDEGVKSVFELARLAGLSKVGIICTKSDDIEAEEAKKDWKGQRAKRIQQLNNAVFNTQSQLEEINRQLADYDDEHDDLEEEDKQFVTERTQEHRKTTKLLDQHRFNLKKYLVETRNAAVIQQLHAEYHNKVAPNALQVFCVSNKLYWSKRSKPKDAAFPSIQLSGILAVRKHCRSIMADTQMTVAINFVIDDIPALLGEVALWVESGAGSADAERKRAVREVLSEVELRMKKELTAHNSEINKFAKDVKEEFRSRLYTLRRMTIQWNHVAVQAGLKWHEWAHPTYSAFCRNYGNHWTRAAGSHDWNEEIIHGMTTDLTSPWQSFCSSFTGKLDNTNALIEDSLRQALQLLEAELEDGQQSVGTLIQALDCRKNILLSQIDDLCDKSEASLRILGVDALSGMRTSFIGKAMESSYRACNLESGGGSDQRRKRIINDKLKSHDLFHGVMEEFRKGFFSLADSFQEDLQDIIETHLEVIGTTLDMIRVENVATESEDNPELRRLLEYEVAVIRDRMQQVQGIVRS